MTSGKHTFSEILSQPQAWAAALQHAGEAYKDWRSLLGDSRRPLIFLGCGSTHYLAGSMAALFRRLTTHPTIAFPGGEFLYRREDFLGKRADGSDRAVMIVVSRSGETSESVRAAQEYRAEGGKILAVTTRPGSALTTVADETLLLPEAQEESVAQTRSFSSMFVGLNALAALLGEHSTLWQSMQALPQAGEQLLQRYASLAKQVGEDLSLERFYFLGSGWQYGLASEASLKMKEISLSHSEPFYFLEFRHGPMSMVNEHTLIFGLLSETAPAAEQKVLQDMQALGARPVSVGKEPAQVAFDAHLPGEGGGALYLPILQLIAYHRALAKGLDPDRPHNLQAVITLDFSNQGEKK